MNIVVDTVPNDPTKPHICSVEFFADFRELPLLTDSRIRPLSDMKHVDEFASCYLVFDVAPDYNAPETIEVRVRLEIVDYIDGKYYFDNSIESYNGGWASLRDQHKMIGTVLDYIEEHNLIAIFGLTQE